MQGLFAQLGGGHIGWASGLLWLAIAFVLAVVGGAIAGVRLAGKDLGNELAAMMGAMFGPTAAVPAVAVALLVLAST
ncbi:MAG: hypothetical protein V4792_05600 [Pseudomonadota bacterium]